MADDETRLGSERLHNELRRTTSQLEIFAAAVDEGSFLESIVDDSAGPAGPALRRVLQPLGPVAVFSASNFPLAFSVAGGDTASAIAAGCPVIVKAHEGHPRLSQLVGQVLREVWPEGALQIVYGRSAGRSLVLDASIAAVSFTGSTSGGEALLDLINMRPRPIPFYGELGSINPVIVTPAAAAARGDSIAESFVKSFTLGHGQFCTKPGLLFVPPNDYLIEALVEKVGGVAGGPLLGEWIEGAFYASCKGLSASPGVRHLADGRSGPAPQLYAVNAEHLSADVARECFGPASLVVEYRSEEDLFRALGFVLGSLTATIHAELPVDGALASRLVRWAEGRAGRIIWNGWPTGVAVSWAMHHGGPWPATTSPLHTSVGATAVRRFLTPVCYQDVPEVLLPSAVQSSNPMHLPRRVIGV